MLCLVPNVRRSHMLDLAFIREHPDLIKSVARRRKADVDVDALLALDAELRETRRRAEDLRAEQNRLSKSIREAGADREAREGLIARGREVASALKELEPRERELEARLRTLWLLVPNIPDATVPEGQSEEDNVETKRWGTPPAVGFEPLDHVSLMRGLDMLDLERGVKVAGSRSYILKGDAALLELALLQFALDSVSRQGFTPLSVPAMAKEFSFIGNGQFPRGRDQTYALPEDELYLVGTAEVSITGMHSGEILRAEDLPIKYAAWSPCFRREADHRRPGRESSAGGRHSARARRAATVSWRARDTRASLAVGAAPSLRVGSPSARPLPVATGRGGRPRWLVVIVPVEVVDAHDAEQRRSGVAAVGIVSGIPGRGAERAGGGIRAVRRAGRRDALIIGQVRHA